MEAIVIKFRCAGCDRLHAMRTMVVTAAGLRCSLCQATGRVQLAQARKVEIERDAMRRAA